MKLIVFINQSGWVMQDNRVDSILSILDEWFILNIMCYYLENGPITVKLDTDGR